MSNQIYHLLWFPPKPSILFSSTVFRGFQSGLCTGRHGAGRRKRLRSRSTITRRYTNNKEKIVTTIKDKLLSGNAVFGRFIKAGDPCMIEIYGYSGFDCVLLDMGHSPFSIEHVEHLIRAAEIGGLCPFVRASSHCESSVLHPLDKGAKGFWCRWSTTEKPPDALSNTPNSARRDGAASMSTRVVKRSKRFVPRPPQPDVLPGCMWMM